MSLDRTIAPTINPIAEISWIDERKTRLKNGIEVYSIDSGTQDLVRIEWVFEAGVKYQDRQLQASFCAALLREGTKHHSAEAFNEKIDFCGAFLNTEYDRDFATVSLFCLSKYLGTLLPLIREMITEPAFEQSPFEVHSRNALQQYIVDETKVATQARKSLTRMVMGSGHYYGTFASKADYEQITLEEIKSFFEKFYRGNAPRVFVAGKLPGDFETIFANNFGDIPYSNSIVFPKKDIVSSAKHKEFTEIKDAVQYAVRLGKIVPGPLHPDATQLKVALTIWGGYFGSRLMKNIREEKGYTYGIHAGISGLTETSMLIVSTEVGNANIEGTLKEIGLEAKRMQQEPVPEDELALVKNYLAGNLVKDADGPLAQCDRLKYRVLCNLPADFHKTCLDRINAVTAEEVLKASQQYLGTESFYEALAGAKPV